MARQTPNLIQYGLSPEATYGTYVAPISGEWLPKGNGSTFNSGKEMIDLEASLGTPDNLQERRISKEMGQGDIVVPMSFEAGGTILGGIMDYDASPTGTGPYTHTYSGRTDNNPQSFTIVRTDEQGAQRHFTGALLSTLSFNYEATGGYMFFTANFMSKPNESQSDVTPAYANETFIAPDMATLEIQDSDGSYSAANVDVRSFTLNFDNGLIERIKGGTVDLQGLSAGALAVDGSLTIDKTDDTAYNEAFTNQTKKMKLTITSGTNVIEFDLQELTFDGPELSADIGNEFEQMTRPFTVNAPTSNVAISITNGVAAYPIT